MGVVYLSDRKLLVSGKLYMFQEGMGKLGLVDCEIRPFHVQDGLVHGDGRQVLVPST